MPFAERQHRPRIETGLRRCAAKRSAMAGVASKEYSIYDAEMD
jgi:hypothetical protein